MDDYSREFLCVGHYTPPTDNHESSAIPQGRDVYYYYYCPDIRELHVEQVFDPEGNVYADRAQIRVYDDIRVVCENYGAVRDAIRAARSHVVVRGFDAVDRKPLTPKVAKRKAKPKTPKFPKP